MKDTVEKIFLMGLGAMSMTSEKASELKDELLKKGEEAYKNGQTLNEELKHNIKEKIKENVTVVVNKDLSKEELADRICKLSEEEKAEILEILNTKNNDEE